MTTPQQLWQMLYMKMFYYNYTYRILYISIHYLHLASRIYIEFSSIYMLYPQNKHLLTQYQQTLLR